MNQRHLRTPFRHAAHRGPLRPTRIPLLSAAAIGAASMVALSVGHSGHAAPADRANPGTVLDLSAAGGGGTRARVAAERAAQDRASRDQTRQAPVAAASPTTAATAATPSPSKPAAPAAPGKKELYYQFQLQPNGYYCGPAATRIAITSLGLYPSQDRLADQLHTTFQGTDSAADVTRVLNSLTKSATYHATFIPSKKIDQTRANRLRADVVGAVSQGHPVVMNIVGTGTDANGTSHSYGGGHYLTVVGYRDGGKQVKIADPANPAGDGTYWMNTWNLTGWAGTRGYAS